MTYAKTFLLTSVLSTPQNTPANNAPISSHAQQPGVGTIKEGMLRFLPLTEICFQTTYGNHRRV